MTATAKVFGYEFREGVEQMKAGKYRVTDPCYFLGHDDDFWSNFCSFMFGEDRTIGSDSYTIEIAGYKVLAWGTAYGDGCYPTLKDDVEIGSSGVDAGMLSLIPIELYDLFKDHLGENDDSSAPIVELAYDLTPHIKEGDCSYGDYQTLTGNSAKRCGDCGCRDDLNWNSLCSSCQQERDNEAEEHLRQEEADNEEED